MNDYERLAEDIDAAIQVTETAYYNATDDEDAAALDEALDILKATKTRVEEKA